MAEKIEEEISVFVEEQDAIREYIETVYTERVPPPTQPNTSFWNLVGLKTVFFSMSSLGAIIFSAIRTGGYFYIVEVSLLSKFNIPESLVSLLATAAFIAALFAFEGFAVADGFSKGEKMNSVEESNWGLWASFLTITLVGIFSGLEIASIPENVRNGFSIITAILTSISAASIAFFGGKNLGFAVRDFNEKKKIILSSHQVQYDDWREGAFRSYTSTMGSIKKRVRSSVQSEQESERGVQGGVQSLFTEERTPSISEQAFSFVNDFVQENGKIPTVTEVETLGRFKRTMSSYAIQDFIVFNADALVRDGLVTPERAGETKIKVDKRNSK